MSVVGYHKGEVCPSHRFQPIPPGNQGPLIKILALPEATSVLEAPHAPGSMR
ncbi:hypothetical protein SNOG_06706 [Parastagonospora nodorum SN15]|uniref:Uncharacterized protein n=1 Tax=Phaeosphaeria nodorum (strain SN15 / ATCC MYA-4574 / FGSC 10173) TaxID=321614 RepID=Q0UNF8_PHANO|nr:hypothetical protein SNOG_06706 [Parastagonospora nodorum SN15]EAT85357.1 hypothetical protein SNOG_06706 [Parastagonospora nodorum SN15]